ncbi:lysine biosynthesis protein LysX [Candidatus Bathyarchaeota archaeon]|nr:lysine biosynthesis protein LysX [Candidatus Bathyarchaeota archaeon]
MIPMGLVYDRIRWEEKELIRASKEAGVPLKLIDAKKVYINLFENANVLKKVFESVVLQRCVSYFRGLHITAILENMEFTVINPLNVSLTCGNKLFTTLALTKAGVPTPKTVMAFTPQTALNALDALGYPAVLKPVVGSWGRLVAQVKDRESAQALIETREEIRSALLRIYYIQEMVKRPPKDIRIIVIGDEVVVAYYRYSPPDDWRTNIARGGVSKPCPITSELEQLAVKASEAVGGGIVAVDCMESPEGILVHEVNGTIEFRGASFSTNVDIARKIMDYVIKVLKK